MKSNNVHQVMSLELVSVGVENNKFENEKPDLCSPVFLLARAATTITHLLLALQIIFLINCFLSMKCQRMFQMIFTICQKPR